MIKECKEHSPAGLTELDDLVYLGKDILANYDQQKSLLLLEGGELQFRLYKFCKSQNSTKNS